MRRRMEEAHSTLALATVASITIVMISSLFSNVGNTSAMAQSGAVVDLYTEKTPFDGRGANQSSDAFEPQELVVLHANVEYNGWPEQNKPVAFQINGPRNQFQNITIIGSGRTDVNGTAGFSFRLPWPEVNAEDIIFGEWNAIATVDVAGEVVVDTMIFRVGWIIRITEISTLDSLLNPQSVFALQDPIVFNLTVENIARTAKSAIIQIDVQDSNQQPIIHVQTEDILFQPGNSNVQAQSQIPISAHLGQAIVSADPFTTNPENGGKLYSPSIYTTIQITKRDIAITGIKLSKNTIFVGETLEIDATVFNTGNESATFDLSVYCNSSLFETLKVVDLAPSQRETFAFFWNTSHINPGLYQVSADAPLLGDPTPSDNSLIDGMVEVKTRVSPYQVPRWLVLSVIIALGVVAGLISLFLILCMDRVRRRRNRLRSTYTVIVHPHI